MFIAEGLSRMALSQKNVCLRAKSVLVLARPTTPAISASPSQKVITIATPETVLLTGLVAAARRPLKPAKRDVKTPEPSASKARSFATRIRLV